MKSKILILGILIFEMAPRNLASAQVQQAWAVRYRGPGFSESVAHAIVLDSAANVIVTGRSYGEYATAKYDRNGNEIWEARYHGPGLGDNVARSMAVDKSDNIYVTGHSFGAGNNFDYATVKYDPDGNQLWLARYNSMENTNDFARAIAVDKAGNVYVTGTSAAQMEPFDEQGENGTYTTIKYGANGNQLWVARYAGESDNGFRDSQAHAIAVDPAGNAYVTGYSTGSGSFYDFCTIKYDPDGNQLWVARYDGPAHGLDEAYSLALDSAGNVYVTGGSNGDTSYDYVTVKYDTDGHQLWVARYNGPADSIDEANAIAVDKAGNVYVTGNSADSSQTDDDMATIKYDANGNQLWVARYGGTLSDKAFAIALDNISNVYVAGYSDAGFFFGFDYATVKYDANGNRNWVATYAGPGSLDCGGDLDNIWAIAVDGAGDVYVTGQSDSCLAGGSVYATIKYTEGSISNLPPTIVDQPQSETALGGNNVTFNVDVSGAFPLNLQWQFSGANLANATNWTLTLTNVQSANAGEYRVIASNAFGSATSVVALLTVEALLVPPTIMTQPQNQTVLVGGNVTFTVNASGPTPFSYQWNFNATNLLSTTNAILALTNVQITNAGDYSATVSNPYGSTTSSIARLTVQLRESPGVPMWTNRYGSLDWNANPSAIAVDSSGKVFVTGYVSFGDPTSPVSDYATVAYSNAGVPLWTNRYNGGNAGDGAIGVGVDGSGNVFVAGRSYRTGSDYDYATIKYSGAGVPLWTNRYNGPEPENSSDIANALAVDGSGNVFVTGSSWGGDPAGGGSHSDFATVAYSGVDVPLWTNRYNGPGNGQDVPYATAVDSRGNVFVTGSSISRWGTAGVSDYVTVAYSSSGVPLWTNRYSGLASSFAFGIAVDSSGNVLVTGYSYGSGSGADYLTIKYSNAGVPLWTNRFDGGNGDDLATALAVDRSGNVYVHGISATTNVYPYNYGYATVAYSGAGVPSWTNRYHGPGNGSDQAGAIAVDTDGNVFATGSSFGINGYTDYATVAYSSAGMPLWINRFHGPGNLDDHATAIAVDSSGNVFVTGFSGGGAGYDFATIKYSSSLLPVHLDFQTVNDQLVLSWTNSFFSLQAAPVITGTFTNIPGASSPHTNRMTGSQQYFRLKPN